MFPPYPVCFRTISNKRFGFTVCFQYNSTTPYLIPNTGDIWSPRRQLTPNKDAIRNTISAHSASEKPMQNFTNDEMKLVIITASNEKFTTEKLKTKLDIYDSQNTQNNRVFQMRIT
ncbi:hypothetical protein DINM_006246 [Dirofilaria immitis]|nr:hypothetical protein [Dirofilaria immitis]